MPRRLSSRSFACRVCEWVRSRCTGAAVAVTSSGSSSSPSCRLSSCLSCSRHALSLREFQAQESRTRWEKKEGIEEVDKDSALKAQQVCIHPCMCVCIMYVWLCVCMYA
jgi:hypothetical protein